MTRLRSVLYPLRLVRARLGKWSGPVVLVVLGIAAGASVVVGGRAGAVVAQDRAVAQAVERIPDGSRSVRAVWFGIPAQSDEPQPVLERRARVALRHVVDADARALVLFRESTIGGTFAGLGGVQGLGSQVALRSGRLPSECRPERCEVLRLRGAAGRLPEPEGLKLVEVGTGALKSRLLFGDFLRADRQRARCRRGRVLPSLAPPAITGLRRRLSSSPRASGRSRALLLSTWSFAAMRGWLRSKRDGLGCGRSTTLPPAWRVRAPSFRP